MAIPPPVPVLPDSARITSYAAVASAGPFDVGFAIYGDGTDYASWLSVTLDGVDQAPGWVLTSDSGALATLARPITDAKITLPLPVTGNLVITGARRPRRTTQLNENQGEPSRSRNQTYTDMVAMLREDWDLRPRTPLVPAGETIPLIPALALRAGNSAVWGLDGALTYLAGGLPLGVPGFIGLKATYGAKGDGVTNDTAALLQADAIGGYCFVEPGTYVINVSVLTNLKGLFGLGQPTFIPSGSVPTGGTQAFLMLFSGAGCNDAVVTGCRFSASKATYPNLYLLCASATTDVHFADNVTVGGGIGIYGANCANHYVERNHVSSYAAKGISHDGAAQGNVSVNNNHVDGAGSTIHGISFQLGGPVSARGNFIKAPAVFGLEGFQCIRVTFVDNDIFNSGHEAINTEDASVCIVTGNLGYWDVGISLDFGLSIFGNAADNQFTEVSNNILVNSNSAGIALANRVSFSTVRGNIILNCCRAATSGGIQLSGANCLKNVVTGNYCIDVIGGLQRSGVQESDEGVGLPSLNYIRDNYIEGWTVSPVEHLNALKPPILAANTNNWSPTSLHYYEFVVVQASSAIDLTGLADNYAGSRKVLWLAGANNVTLKDNSASSTAGLRFSLGSDLVLTPGASVALEYVPGVLASDGAWVRT